MKRRLSWMTIGLVTVAVLTIHPLVAKGQPDPARVRYYQAKLLELGYWLPDINGMVDRDTRHAVIALQKVAGLKRTGEIDMPTKKAIEAGVRPKARQGHTYRVVEIDLERQVMLLVKDKEIRWIIDVSTGKPSTPTKRGWNKIYRKYDGYRPSGMYRPTYFWRSAAIHGYYTVPEYAASHGCVRVTNGAMDFLWQKEALPHGMPLYIY
jgi:N-acetylmuramoyl-L-alanine amidase